MLQDDAAVHRGQGRKRDGKECQVEDGQEDRRV
jgi:hypothetical protein